MYWKTSSFTYILHITEKNPITADLNIGKISTLMFDKNRFFKAIVLFMISMFILTSFSVFNTAENAMGNAHATNSKNFVNVSVVSLYKMVFKETGLPSGTIWYVTTDSMIPGYYNCSSSSNNSITVSVPNGGYDYRVDSSIVIGHYSYYAQSTTGTVTINGQNQTINIQYLKERLYNVEFKESGLPAGLQWGVNIRNLNYSNFNFSTTGLVNMSVSNGTYTYIPNANDLGDFAYIASSGTVTVNGQNQTINLLFLKERIYKIEFKETGLPANTRWNVNANSYKYINLSSTDTLNLTVPNGTYIYKILSPIIIGEYVYCVSPSSGTVTVNGQNQTINVLYVKERLYKVEFMETGLPAGTSWTASMNFELHINTTSTDKLNLTAPNGTYYYSINAPITIGDCAYYLLKSSGNVTINGQNQTINLQFLKERLYKIEFMETGLPTNSGWYVSTSSYNYSSSVYSISDSLNVSAPNGTSVYAISSDNLYYTTTSLVGLVNITAGNKTIDVSFQKVAPPKWLTVGDYFNYSINSLIAGYDNISIKSYNYSSGMIQLCNDMNGNKQLQPYNVTDFTFSQYLLTPSISASYSQKNISALYKFLGINSTLESGIAYHLNNRILYGNEIILSGNGVFASIVVDPTYDLELSINLTMDGLQGHDNLTSTNVFLNGVSNYNVTFTESGLPSGTSWSVSLGGSTISSTTDKISFYESNGTYSYTVSGISGYTSSPSSGSITVKGNVTTQAISFTPVSTTEKYSVKFTEKGIPSGTAWYVNLSNGMKSGSITGSSYTFLLANGTYSYTAANISGYTSSPSSGSINVKGSNLTIGLTYTSTTYSRLEPLPSQGSSTTYVYTIVGAIVILAMVGAVFAVIRKRK